MAKKKSTIQNKSTKTIRFVSFLREPTVAPKVDRSVIDQIPWVYHDWDNLYPEHLRNLVNNCGPLERCITQMAEFIAGMGVEFVDEEGNPIEAAQAKFQEWMIDSSEEQFLAQTAYDIAHGLGMTWAVRRAAGGKIVRLDHRSRFGFRAGKTVTGVIPNMYWSNDWAEANWNSTDPRFKPKEIPMFDFSGKRVAAEAIIFERQYHPTEPVYGLIYWLGCRRAAENWVKVDNYNRTQMDTGFTPAVMLGTRFEGTDAQIDDHEEKIELSMTGSMGKGMLVFTMGPDEKEPFFQALPRGNHAGELDEMRNGSADVVHETFGIPSLLMRDRSEGLTSQERSLAIRLQQFQRTVVARLQKMPGRTLTKLMNLEGIPVWETRFKPLEIFDPVQEKEIIVASQTVDEARQLRGDEPMKDKKIGEMLIAQAQKLASDPEEAKEIAKMKAKQTGLKPEKEIAQ